MRAGVIDAQDRVFVNPARMRIAPGVTLIVVGTTKKAVVRALRAPYEPLSDQERERLRVRRPLRRRQLRACGSFARAGVRAAASGDVQRLPAARRPWAR